MYDKTTKQRYRVERYYEFFSDDLKGASGDIAVLI